MLGLLEITNNGNQMTELHPGLLLKCKCGNHIIIRLVEDIYVPYIECRQCKTTFLPQQVMRKAKEVLWYYCDECAQEVIIQDEIEEPLLCPNCKTEQELEGQL